MKKRVLSFLVACVMVASTFIISKPLVHVHAVDSETTYVEDENMWTLPMNWSKDLDSYTDSEGNTWEIASKKNGLWKLTSFADPSDYTAPNFDGTISKSWVESAHNRVQKGASALSDERWYVNFNGRWAGGTAFYKGNNSEYMRVSMSTVKSGTYQVDENGEYVLVTNSSGEQVKVNMGVTSPSTYSKNPAVIFTAPENGTYSYSELVTANNLIDDSALIDARETAKRFAVNVTVRKNGVVIDSYLLDEDDESKTLEGTVALEEGDLLAFVFSMITDNAKLGIKSTAETARYAVTLGETVVKKVGEYPDSSYTAKVDLTPRFEVGSYTDKLGNVTLMGCNITTKELYSIESHVTETNNNSWLALDPLGKHGTAYSLYGNNKGYNLLWGIDKTTGLIMAVGGAQLTSNTGSALVFEAPYDGMFSFDVTMTSCYPYAKTSAGVENFRYHDFTIAKEDGTILVTKHNEGATAKHASVTITAAAELKAGEKVIITKTPHANNSTQLNASCNGTASVAIYEVEHICSADTVEYVAANDATCVAEGNVAHYACSCGEIYADAEATTVYTGDVEIPVDEDAHAPATEWTTDDDGHWYACNNGCDEKLSYAEHDWTNGVCGTCELACPAHDMKNAEGKCANCGMTHKHAWTDGVCDTCGYECQHTGGTATCANQAKCTACGSYYGDVDKTNHEQEGYWIDNGDGTCYFYYPCCYAPTADPDEFEAALQPHEYDDDADMTCNHCGYDRTVVVAEDNFGEVFESVFTEGATTDHVAQGPAEGALDNSGAVKGEAVTGFTYRGFNLEMISSTSNVVKLRHHILLADGLTVKVDGEAVALENVSGNYYYFEVEVEVGQFSTAHVITVEGTTVVTASVHSYMKTAFESGTLTAEQTNLLNALYDWDYAVANAN